MAKTSINVQPIKNGSESHNLRKKELYYVREDLTHLNQEYIKNYVAPELKKIKELYKKSVGQKMQKKATPIREGVVVLDENVTMDNLKKLGAALESKFGIRTMQIHIHDDEGHRDKKTKEWKKNRHAHMVFNWTDKETGKNLGLKRNDMVEMQTLVAKYLNMERGVKSGVKHLDATQFKAKAAEEKLEEIEQNIKKAEAVKSKLISVDDYNSLVGKFNNILEEHQEQQKKIKELQPLIHEKKLKEEYKKNWEIRKRKYNDLMIKINDVIKPPKSMTNEVWKKKKQNLHLELEKWKKENQNILKNNQDKGHSLSR